MMILQRRENHGPNEHVVTFSYIYGSILLPLRPRGPEIALGLSQG